MRSARLNCRESPSSLSMSRRSLASCAAALAYATAASLSAHCLASWSYRDRSFSHGRPSGTSFNYRSIAAICFSTTKTLLSRWSRVSCRLGYALSRIRERTVTDWTDAIAWGTAVQSCRECLCGMGRLRIERTDFVRFIISTLKLTIISRNTHCPQHRPNANSPIIQTRLGWCIFKYRLTMDKNSLNVIIFEDDEAPAKDPRRTASSKSPSHSPHNAQYDIIEQEIQFLTDKVRALQQQTEGLTLFRNDSNCTQRNSVTNIEAAPHRDLLMAIERKIQIVIKETRKLVDKLGESFEKKLEGKLGKKYDELGVAKIKENYAAALRKAEDHYRKEIERANKDFKDAEARMLARVAELEHRLLTRANDFEIKEKEYVAWIHHLEQQLKEPKEPKEGERRSRKMIELTQERAGRREEEGSILSSNLENNYSSINQNSNNNRISPLAHDQNTSKMHRKHRIFDNNKGASVSPNNKLHSHPQQPQHPQHPQHPQQPQPAPALLQSLSPALQSSKLVNPATRTRPADPQPEQPVTVSLATRNQEPLRNVFASENESSPWRMIERDSGKRPTQASVRNKVIENVREEEFLKDVPKPNSGWDKFQDFKEVEDDESSDSDQDVLFYREGDQDDFLDHFRSTKRDPDPKKDEQKVFSPFDLS